MDGARAVAREAASVRKRPIAFVLTEFVRGENVVERFHNPIPDDLGDDGRGRDGEDSPVAVDDALVGHGERQSPGVDEGEVGLDIKFVNGLCQRSKVRGLNALTVNDVRSDDFR